MVKYSQQQSWRFSSWPKTLGYCASYNYGHQLRERVERLVVAGLGETVLAFFLTGPTAAALQPQIQREISKGRRAHLKDGYRVKNQQWQSYTHAMGILPTENSHLVRRGAGGDAL